MTLIMIIGSVTVPGESESPGRQQQAAKLPRRRGTRSQHAGPGVDATAGVTFELATMATAACQPEPRSVPQCYAGSDSEAPAGARRPGSQGPAGGWPRRAFRRRWSLSA